MLIADALTEEAARLVRRVVRKAGNSGEVAIEALGGALVENADLRAEMAAILLRACRGEMSSQRRLRREAVEAEAADKAWREERAWQEGGDASPDGILQ